MKKKCLPMDRSISPCQFALPYSLWYGFSTCLASLYNHICELLAINLLTYISNWFFFSGSTLTDTEINVVSALSLYVLINIIRAVCFQ